VKPQTLVLLELASAALPLVLLAWLASVYPTRRLVLLGLVPCAISFSLLAAPEMLWLLVGLDVMLGVVVLADLATVPARGAFSADREAGRVASLRKRHPVTLIVSNHSSRAARVWIRDWVPHRLCPSPEEFFAPLPGRSRATFQYVLRPSRRGAFTIGPVHLRIPSRLGFWQRMLLCPVQSVIHVYPDLKQLAQYALLARTNRLRLLGVRRARRVGQDHDFERLRDYAVDDNYKHIEWRATARRQKLTVKEFQSSQSQRIVFLLDCGRMMTNEAAGLSLLDHAMNASLMLAHVALRRGDAVGMICFSDEIHSFVPVRSGMNQMNRLLHACFDRFPRLVESRYDEAFRYLGSRVRKRTLVILVTNVIDEVNAHQVERYLGNLVGRHLPLGVLLRDRRLFEAVELAQPHGSGLWRAAAAAEILAWRHQVITDLQGRGVLALDVFPEDMTAPLINRYLEIKARHLL